MRANTNNTIRQIQQLLADDKKLMMVMIGPPGSGKSTLIAAMQEAGIIFRIASTDAIVDEYAATHGITYSQAHQKVNWKDAQSKFKTIIRQSANDGVNIVIDRTNMGEKARRGYFDVIRNRGYTAVALNMQCDDRELQKRIDERAAATGKFIPKHVMKDMMERYDAPTTREGFNLIIDVLTQTHT